jgi:hypothetical protein
MPSQIKPLYEQLDTWMQELQEIKTAAAPQPSGQTKAAGPSGMGKTTHPSEKVDNYTHNAPEGARYRENEADVKKDVPANVEEASSKMDEDKVMPNIGTQQAATGEQTSVERDFKGTKDDGTTSHPADAEDVGEKYSSVSLTNLLKMAEAKANALLADIGNGLFGGTISPAQPAPQNKQASTAQPQATPANVTAGYATAAAAGTVDEQQLQKLAAAFIEQAVRDADLDADLVGAYITSWQQKRAAEDEEEPKPLPGADEGGPGGGDVPPPGMPPMPMVAGGPGGPGAGPDAGMPPAGGPPGGPAGGPAGADPLASLNAAAGDAAPSAGDKQQALQDLLMALQELGIDPAQLADLSQQGGPEMAEKGAKLASAAIAFQRTGRFRFAEAKTAQQRKNRDLIKDYVMEVAGLKG